VRIVTPDGEVYQRAHLVPDLGADRVSAERWWYPEQDGTSTRLFGVLESNVNSYTTYGVESCDPAYGALPFRNASCRIERAPPAFLPTTWTPTTRSQVQKDPPHTG
jgi:hypothetical protein